MQASEIKARFDRVFNGQKNFLTPNVLNYGKRGKLVWELSFGEGFRQAGLYGVTVIELPSTNRRDLSTSFNSRDEAMAYIKANFQEVTV